MVVSAGNLYDEAEVRFDHELAGLGFSTTNPAGYLFFVLLSQEGSLPNSLEVGLKSGRQFTGLGENPVFLSFTMVCFHTRFDRRRKRTFGLFFSVV